jgi:hypothetical protein
MTGPVRRLLKALSRHSDQDEEYAGSQWDFDPGERIGEPLPRRRGRLVRRGLMLLAVLGVGWTLYDDPSVWPRWWAAGSEIAAPLIDRALKAVAPSSDSPAPGGIEPVKNEARLDAPPAFPPFPAPSTTGPIGGSASAGGTETLAAPRAEAPVAAAALPSPRSADPPPAALPPPPPADPYEARARAVGLHPDISRVLLSKLSETDYRNAAYAIRTALASTPESATFTWPRERKPGLALFEVRFVPGADPGCRRYVVSVEKDRWVTTALPVETCGDQLKQAGR